jgi:hypothetical protein
MLRSPARRTRPIRFRPRIEGLEDRALAAPGQIELIFPQIPIGLAAPVTGDLPNGAIDVASYNFTSFTSGGIQFSPLEIQTHIGPQTAGLFQVETNGYHFPEAVLVVRNDAAQLLAVYRLGFVQVSSLSESMNSGDATGTESDVLTFGSVQINAYNPTTNTPTATSSYSVLTNMPTLTIQALVPSPTLTTESLAPDSVATSLTLNTSRIHGSGGPEVSLRAKVTSTGGVPVGNVTFYSGKARLGAVPVQADGTATLTLPASAVGRGRPFAIYSGGYNSPFMPSSSVSGESRMQRLFQASFHRPMNPDEWTLTSMWLQQGFTPKSMGSIYRSLAAHGG